MSSTKQQQTRVDKQRQNFIPSRRIQPGSDSNSIHMCFCVCVASHTEQELVIGQKPVADFTSGSQQHPYAHAALLRMWIISNLSCADVIKHALCSLRLQPHIIRTHSQNQQHVSPQHSLSLSPSSSSLTSLASSYLNEHPRPRDEITHFWHFSAKSGMGAKNKIRLSETSKALSRSL